MTPTLITTAREAMATRFEVAMHGDDPTRLRAAGGEALDEITRLEGMLTIHEPTSEIAHCNNRAAHEPVPVSPEVYALLQRCHELTEETAGAFDITIAPLMRCWRFINDTGTVPAEDEIEQARACVGTRYVELDEANCTVRYAREGVMLDLGSIGKGYAIECAAALLTENEFENFLIHGGTSTACARGTQPDGIPWRIAIEHPDEGEPPLRIVDLHDESLSVSGIGGKSFIDADGNEQGHVIDPRTGRPTQAARVAAVICESATESDALATALLTEGSALLPRLRPNIRALTASIKRGRLAIQTHNLD
jgi:thiamine biosynthesis lipoprotein